MEMFWLVVVVAVCVVAAVDGQLRFSYDGTPDVDGDTVVAPVFAPEFNQDSVSAFQSGQPQAVMILPSPQPAQQLPFTILPAAQQQPVTILPAPQPAQQQPVTILPAPQPAQQQPATILPALQPAQQLLAVSTPRPVVAFSMPQAVQPQQIQFQAVSPTQSLQFLPAPRPTLQPPVFPSPAFPRGHPLSCAFDFGSLVHATFNNREYHFSWCRRPTTTYSFQQAQDYCTSLPNDGHPVGFHAVSIEDQPEDTFISVVIQTYHVRFIWTSGRKVASSAWRWQSSVSSHYSHWSHTGRFGRSQPDNADGNEDCLAILNNFYGDGITWHDIQCHIEKYIICERPRRYGS